ncbi:hypothetical protein ABEB36_002907 [Hypothenemus hampei]|uniref:RNA helicase n=1 Tax=Hypothenemus hampei TaxID=57062 RepID=A0ABD1F7C8_HYPHA
MFEVKILDYKATHIFLITVDVDGTVQRKFSDLIRKYHTRTQDDCLNEVIAVHYEDQYARANILDIFCDDGINKRYNCWLIDCGQKIICDVIYKLPKYIQEIEPNCKVASLNNFCYLNNVLELGLKGSITSIQSCSANSGVTKCALDLISNSDKIIFELKQKIENVLLIGDLIIHKRGRTLCLSDELKKKGLIATNDSIFPDLVKQSLDYINSYFKIKFPSSTIMQPCDPAEETEETEFDPTTLPPLDLDRRRRTEEPNKMSRGRELLKKMKATKLNKNTEEDLSSVDSSSFSEENSNAKTESVLQSPFASLTPAKNIKLNHLFIAAGSEGMLFDNKFKKLSKTLNTIEKKCSTVKISQVSSSGSNTETDNLSVAESLSTAETSSIAESSSITENSSSRQAKIFTKQEFCKFGEGCSCTNCRMTLEDDDWEMPLVFHENTEKFIPVVSPKEPFIKPLKLVKINEPCNEEDPPQIDSVDYGRMSSMEKKMSSKVLVHGETVPHPIKRVADVNIHKNIYDSINFKSSFESSQRIQHYAFPSVTRNQHVFMVNDKESGQTMAYLPILISFILEKEERYKKLLKISGGPFVTILCSNSKKCEKILYLANSIYNRRNVKYKLVTYPEHDSLNNIDVLITMPTVLSNLLSSRAINFKRLCHFVLEDADVILESHYDLFKKYLAYCDQILEHRTCSKSIQLILCAHYWTKEMEMILLDLNQVPIVCIGNHLQAALYGKTKFTFKFLESYNKEMFLLKLLKDDYKYVKSVVICNTVDIENVESALSTNGIELQSFRCVTKEEEMLFMENSWNNENTGNFSALLCTDEIFNTLSITCGMRLIHYSLPLTWSQFTRRFSCLMENIRSPLSPQNKLTVSCYVLIDENCEDRMAKFSHFMKVSGLEKKLPEVIRTFFQECKVREEQNRVTNQVELCSNLKVFGECNGSECQNRHILSKDLDIAMDNYLPKNGMIKFQIITMTNASSCSIKFLEHYDLNGKKIKEFLDLSAEISYKLKSLNDLENVDQPELFQIYLLKKEEEYLRCRVIKIKDSFCVYLLEKGIFVKCSIANLFKIPQEFLKYPPQCFEAYLANLIPPYGDKNFSMMSHRKAQHLLDRKCSKSLMIGTISLQLGENLWLNDVYEYQEKHDKTLPVMGFQFTRELVKQGIAIHTRKPLEKLYELCKKASIALPEYKIVHRKVEKIKVEQVKPRWAFLNLEEINEVIFTYGENPSEFYIRQNKFSKQLELLEEDIQKDICKPFYPAIKKIKPGICCLVKDINEKYARGLILRIKGQKAEILSVDYGDVVEQDISLLKYISNNFIEKLPFQSIKCSLYGVRPINNEWTDEATDLLYEMAYENKVCLFLRTLFAKVIKKLPVTDGDISNQFAYEVLLKDSLGNQKLINNLLLECGFAIACKDDVIQNFDIEEVQEEVIEEIVRSDSEFDEKDHTDSGDFDCEIINLVNFMKDMKFPIRNLVEDLPGSSNETKIHELPAIKAAPKALYLTPEVIWSQKNEKLRLHIKITDAKSVHLNIKHNRMFQFRTKKDSEQEYRLDLLLFAKVKGAVHYTIFGSEIKVFLEKINNIQWPRLLFSSEKVRNIHYDLFLINCEDDNDEKRTLLKLGLDDISSDEEDCKRPYFVCSDLDSDYDMDLPEDKY